VVVPPLCCVIAALCHSRQQPPSHRLDHCTSYSMSGGALCLERKFRDLEEACLGTQNRQTDKQTKTGTMATFHKHLYMSNQECQLRRLVPFIIIPPWLATGSDNRTSRPREARKDTGERNELIGTGEPNKTNEETWGFFWGDTQSLRQTIRMG